MLLYWYLISPSNTQSVRRISNNTWESEKTLKRSVELARDYSIPYTRKMLGVKQIYQVSSSLIFLAEAWLCWVSLNCRTCLRHLWCCKQNTSRWTNHGPHILLNYPVRETACPSLRITLISTCSQTNYGLHIKYGCEDLFPLILVAWGGIRNACTCTYLNALFLAVNKSTVQLIWNCEIPASCAIKSVYYGYADSVSTGKRVICETSLTRSKCAEELKSNISRHIANFSNSMLRPHPVFQSCSRTNPSSIKSEAVSKQMWSTGPLKYSILGERCWRSIACQCVRTCSVL